MQQRSVAICILLTVVTCGLYGLYWFVCLTEDANAISGDTNSMSGAMALVFTIITCGIFGLYWAYKMGEKICAAKSQRGIPGDSSLGLLYLLLSVFGLGIIAYALMQNELNQMLPGDGQFSQF